jgi:riboflavin kinase / FMN adenylyltransferase
MDLVTGIASLPLGRGPTAVTVGFFDGVHLGHRAVIGRTVEVARKGGLTPVAVTFDRHPRETLTPGQAPGLLTTMERKAELIAALDIEALMVLEFDQDFSRWPPEDFVSRVLVDGLAARSVVVGANFTFGHKAKGNLEVLTALGETFGFDTEGVSLLTVDGRPVSSSSIREALSAGDLGWPTAALGRRALVDGVVVPGAGRGRGLGFPTANLSVPPRILLPGEGVYAGRAYAGSEAWVAAINVGTNPTFGAEPLHVEAFLLDFEGDVKGQPLSLEFWERLRDELRFESAEDLARQIKEDVERTREVVR